MIKLTLLGDRDEAGMKDTGKRGQTISSPKMSTDHEINSSESFIPFSQRTSMTHAPTMYEELIQKYEGDIRNHIRIEQQMKLHSDSVLNKLEDREKQYDVVHDEIKAMEEKHKENQIKLKMEAKIYKEENEALKKALEKKIERVLNLERNIKDQNTKYNKLEIEFRRIRKHFESSELTPNKPDDCLRSKPLPKNKFKANSALPNSGRKGNSDSVQLFYSRNIKGPNNMDREEFIIPATSTRSPDKVNGQFVTKSIVFKRDANSPYIHSDLERIKNYVSVPKSKTHKRSKSQTLKGNPKTRKAVKSALRVEHLPTDETTDDSNMIRDYNSFQNSIMYKGIKKGVVVSKSSKAKRLIKKKNSSKHQHFLSYDAHSSLNRYDMTNQPWIMDNSMDRINKGKKLVSHWCYL